MNKISNIEIIFGSDRVFVNANELKDYSTLNGRLTLVYKNGLTVEYGNSPFRFHYEVQAKDAIVGQNRKWPNSQSIFKIIKLDGNICYYKYIEAPIYVNLINSVFNREVDYLLENSEPA